MWFTITASRRGEDEIKILRNAKATRQLLYILIVGTKGKEYAWRYKRFESVAQFKVMADAWDKTGQVLILVDIVLVIFILAAAGAFDG